MSETIMQKTLVIDPMNAIAAPDGNSWTALGNDTTGLAVDLDHVFGTKSLEFDKVDGAANTKLGGIQRTLVNAINIDRFALGGLGFILWSINVQAKTNVDYAFIRLGTSASHYNEFRVDASELETYWNLCRVAIADPDSSGALGNGWNSSVITYVAIGLAFDGETNTLADIRVDRIIISDGLVTTAEITTKKSTSVSTGDINVEEIGGATVKVEDQAYAAADPGIPGLIVRKDSAAAVGSGANGDYTQMQGTAKGELRVRDDDVNTDLDTLVPIVHEEDEAYTAADKGVPSLMVRKDAGAAVGSAVDGDYTALQGTASGELRTRDDDANTVLGTIDADTSRIGIVQRAAVTTLINATLFDDAPTTETSSSVDLSSYSKFLLYVDLAVTDTPTDALIQVQFSPDDSAWYDYTNGPFGDLRYEDGAGTINECLSGDAAGKFIRVIVTCTGTDATHKFTITVKVEPYN